MAKPCDCWLNQMLFIVKRAFDYLLFIGVAVQIGVPTEQ